MSQIADYLAWRGDISFQQVPYNEVDAYIIAKIGVPDLKGIVPAEGEGITLREAYQRYFGREDIDPDYFGRLNLPILSEVLRMLPDTERFGGLMLSDYLQKFSAENTEQISALTVTLPGGPTVVTFRGTDDTIVGWKENFLMAVRSTVPAQEDAAEYLTRMAEIHSGPIAVIGHSKGGNLAVYAASAAAPEIQKRITRVYNFDGPGFREDFWSQPGLQRIRDRISNYVSQHTVVGTLLTQSDDITICRCRRSGPAAHEAMLWEVMGPKFVREKKLSKLSVDLDKLLTRQLAQMTDEEVERFVEDFFNALTATGSNTLTELTKLPLDKLRQLVKEINKTESIREFGKDLIELMLPNVHMPEVLKKTRTKRK